MRMDDRLHVRVRSQRLDVDGQLVRHRVAVTGIGIIVESDEAHVVDGGECQAAFVWTAATDEQVVRANPRAHVSEDVLH
jgi:hypothetical protein